MKYNHGDPVVFRCGDNWRHGNINFISEDYMTVTLSGKTVTGWPCNILVFWEDVADKVVSLYDIDINSIKINKKENEDNSE